MKEKESLAGNTDYGKDEDSAEALLKRHEAFISDLEAFKNTIEGLKEQATNCRQQETPIGKLRFIFFTFQLFKKKKIFPQRTSFNLTIFFSTFEKCNFATLRIFQNLLEHPNCKGKKDK